MTSSFVCAGFLVLGLLSLPGGTFSPLPAAPTDFPLPTSPGFGALLLKPPDLTEVGCDRAAVEVEVPPGPFPAAAAPRGPGILACARENAAINTGLY